MTVLLFIVICLARTSQLLCTLPTLVLPVFKEFCHFKGCLVLHCIKFDLNLTHIYEVTHCGFSTVLDSEEYS